MNGHPLAVAGLVFLWVTAVSVRFHVRGRPIPHADLRRQRLDCETDRDQE
jgi:hypothetical protein